MAEFTGQYGGVVKRHIKNAGGKSYVPGAVLQPEDVLDWPLSNRMAMQASGLVDWYGPPVEAESKAREAGSPASPRGKAAQEKQPAQKKAESTPANSRRGRR